MMGPGYANTYGVLSLSVLFSRVKEGIKCHTPEVIFTESLTVFQTTFFAYLQTTNFRLTSHSNVYHQTFTRMTWHMSKAKC